MLYVCYVYCYTMYIHEISIWLVYWGLGNAAVIFFLSDYDLLPRLLVLYNMDSATTIATRVMTLRH